MRHKVDFRLFQDDGTGDFGMAPSNTIDTDRPFNACWTAMMIFHDVFEHYFENRNKYFRGKYAFNVAGEVAAMGHFSYYYNDLSVRERIRTLYNFDFIDGTIRSTLDLMQDGISDNSCRYGDELLCALPYVQPIESYNLNTVIDEHWERVKGMAVTCGYSTADDTEGCIRYRESVTKSKIQRLYRWGWRQASKLVPRTKENYNTLVKFIEDWEKFFLNHDAQEFTTMFRGLEVMVDTGPNLQWKANWIYQDGTRISHYKVQNEDY